MNHLYEGSLQTVHKLQPYLDVQTDDGEEELPFWGRERDLRSFLRVYLQLRASLKTMYKV